jgi:hypothetical protein
MGTLLARYIAKQSDKLFVLHKNSQKTFKTREKILKLLLLF